MNLNTHGLQSRACIANNHGFGRLVKSTQIQNKEFAIFCPDVDTSALL